QRRARRVHAALLRARRRDHRAGRPRVPVARHEQSAPHVPRRDPAQGPRRAALPRRRGEPRSDGARAVIDVDVIVLDLDGGSLLDDCLAAVAEARRNDSVAAAQTILRRDAATIDGAGIDISDGTIRQLGSGLPLGTAMPPAWGVSATAALYRRSALGDRVFDPRFFAYYEDVELCARLHERGH